MPDRTPVALVTGATSGIGEATARELVALGWRVLVHGRSAETAQAAVDRLRSAKPDADLVPVFGDLSSMAAVRSLAEQVGAATELLDAVIANAGLSRPGDEATADGYELHFAANYLANLLLADLLLPQVTAASGRFVIVASSQHTQVRRLEIEALGAGEGIEVGRRYPTSKLLDILLATELARRGASRGVGSFAVDPGFVRTRLGRDASGAYSVLLTLTRPIQVSPEKAAAGIVAVATQPGMSSGGYYVGGKLGEPSALAADAAVARRLWEHSTRVLLAGGHLEASEAL